MLKKIILICLSLFGLARLQAQQVTVNAVLDTGKIRIGEQAKLDLYLTYDASAQKNLQINWPLIEDTLSQKALEVVSVTEIDTTIPDKNKPNIIQQHMRVIVTAFDSGYFAIAPFKFVLNNDTAKPLYTEAMLLEVHTVPTDSTLAKIKDIKPPFDEPFDWRWYLPYAYWGLGILAVIIVIILVVRRLNKNRKQVVVEPIVPTIPAHITALESLEKIKQEAIWKEGKVKEYYSDIADTVRQYIEGRFSINALELTSDEILHIFRSQVVDNDSKEKLRQLLTLSDLAKFAKQTPIEAEHILTLNNAFDFVNGTKRDYENLNNPDSSTTTKS